MSNTLGLQIGSVLRMFVMDTIPPKEKRFIVVGMCEDSISIATVYINSALNKLVNWAVELEALHIPVTKEGRPYLTHDSYIDCSKLTFREVKEVMEEIGKKPESIIGCLSEEDIETVRLTIKEATTIRGRHKKKYGIYGE